MKIKNGVKIGDVKPRTVAAMLIVDGIYRAHDCDLVLTSVCDGVHPAGNTHKDGDAFDCRTHNVAPCELPILIAEVRGALGDEFDVVFEGAGTPNEHLHVEFDP